MNKAKLGDVADFINGLAFAPSDWADIGKKIIRIQNLTDDSKPYNLTNRQVDSKYIVNPGDLLVSWSATLGVFQWNDNDSAVLNQHIFRVLPNEKKVVKPFLKHALIQSVATMDKHTHGATMKHINRKEFLETPLFLPPLDEQRRIAAILDKADAIRRKRQESIRLTEEFLRSTFLEMFGDPVTNPKGVKVVQLSEITTKITDGVHQKPNYTDSGVPFISVKDITTGALKFDNCKFVSIEDHNKFTKRCKAERNDILYTKVGATYGRPALVDTDLEFSLYVSVCLIKPNKNLVDPYYLNAVLGTSAVKNQADKRIKGIGVPDLHLDQIQKFLIPLPSLAEQQEFAQRVATIDKTRSKLLSDEAELDDLFNSLTHRAFRGEL